MLKWVHFARHNLQWQLSKCFLVVSCLAITINFFTSYGYYNYPHVSSDTVNIVLYKEVIPVIPKKGLPDCTYEHVLQSTHSIQNWEVLKNYDDFDAKGIANGSYTPPNCNPRFSVAILITYRNRQEQLDTFLPYIHNFLRKQNIHYKIYLIEQQDEKPWNKGLLYNIGARQAIADRFPCLILQDVDLLPLDDSNLYVCATEPRHMSASIDKFRYVLPYDWLTGGVLAIRADQYKQVDGFSNRFLNWGGEDDDFYMRLLEHDMRVIRFPRWMSRYTMLRHGQTPRNALRWALIQERGSAARAHDGLARAVAAARSVQPHRLFTLRFHQGCGPRDVFVVTITNRNSSAERG